MSDAAVVPGAVPVTIQIVRRAMSRDTMSTSGIADSPRLISSSSRAVVTWLLLLVLPYVALPHDASAGPLLRGLFDVADPLLGGAVWSEKTFALLTGAALMLAATIAITTRLILLMCSRTVRCWRS